MHSIFFSRNYYLNKALALFLDEAKYGLHVGLMLTIVLKKKIPNFQLEVISIKPKNKNLYCRCFRTVNLGSFNSDLYTRSQTPCTIIHQIVRCKVNNVKFEVSLDCSYDNC